MKPIHLLFLLTVLCFGCTRQMQERAKSLNKELAKTPILSASFDSIMQKVCALPFKQRIRITLNVASRNEETRDGLVKQERLLLEILPLGSKKEKKKILSLLIETYRHQDKTKMSNAIDKGVAHCNELLNNYSLTQEERWDIQKKQALLLNEQGKQKEYLPIWYQLLDEHRKADKPELIIEDLRAIASHFTKLDEHKQSISLYKDAYRLAREKQFTELQKQCFAELISLLYDTGHYREVLDSCNQISIDTITTFPFSVYSLQAKCHLQLHRADSARRYLNKMLEASGQGGKMTIFCRMAETYIEEEREDSASVFLNKAIAQYRERMGNNNNMLLPGIFLPVQASYASLLHRKGKLQQAQEAFSMIEPLMKETIKEPTQLKLQIDALVRYSALCRTQGKIREALNLLVHKDSICEIYDTICKAQDSRNQLAIFQSNELIHKNEIQKKELDNSERINSFYLFSGTIISLLLAGYIWGTGKLRNKVKQLLKENTSLKETLQEVPKTTTKGKKKKETETKYISPKSRELFARAEQEVKAKKLFLNQKLRITDLAESLETNCTTLSECININAGVGFNDWVNEFRIRYITKRLNNTSQIEKLYKEAGFASQSTFYASFKKEKGCTPTEHLRNQDA